MIWSSSTTDGIALRFYSMNALRVLPQASRVGIYLSTFWTWEVTRDSSSIPILMLLMLLSNVLFQTGVGAVLLVTLIA